MAQHACCNGNLVSYTHIERLIRRIAVRWCMIGTIMGITQACINEINCDGVEMRGGICIVRCRDSYFYGHVMGIFTQAVHLSFA
jgi:hypothetical protein